MSVRSDKMDLHNLSFNEYYLDRNGKLDINDIQILDKKAEEKKAINICSQKIAKHGLQMKLVDADYNLKTDTAEIAVSFIGEMTSVVKNASGEIVEGDTKQIKRQKDTWTFSKDIKSSDPNIVDVNFNTPYNTISGFSIHIFICLLVGKIDCQRHEESTKCSIHSFLLSSE